MTLRRLLIQLILITTVPSVEPSYGQKPKLVMQNGHSRRIVSGAFSPAGHIVATGGADKMTKLWDSESGRLLQTWLSATEGQVQVAFSPDGKLLATASDWGITVRDVSNGEQVSKYPELDSEIKTLSFRPTGDQLAFGGSFGIVVISAKTGARIYSEKIGDVTALTYAPDGRLIVADQAGAIQILDKTYRRTGSAQTGSKDLRGMVLSRDGDKLLLAYGRALSLWRVGQDNLSLLSESRQSLDVRGVAWALGDKEIAVGHKDRIRFLSATALMEDQAPLSVDRELETLSASPDSKLLLVAGAEGDFFGSWLSLIDLTAHTPLWRQDTNPAESQLSFSADGSLLAVPAQNEIHVWNFKTGERACLFDLKGESPVGQFLPTAFSESGQWLATRTYDAGIQVFDARACQLQRTIDVEGKDGYATVAVDNDANVASRCGATGEDVCVWRQGSSPPLRFKTKGFPGVVRFRPGTHELAVATSEGFVQFWDISMPSSQREVKLSEKELLTFEFTFDGVRFAAGDNDGILMFVDALSLSTTSRARFGRVFQIAFNDDGTRLLSVDREGSSGLLAVWDGRAGSSFKTFRHGMYDTTFAVFQPGSRRIAARTADGSVNIWDSTDLDQENPLCTLFPFSDRTWAVVDDKDRFDAANSGQIPGLHWVVENEWIELSQIKYRYYDPGLLGKILGVDTTPVRDVTRIERLALAPTVEVSAPKPGESALRIKLSNQGGGIGRLEATVNGKQVALGARSQPRNPSAGKTEVSLDFSDSPFLRADGENRVSIRVFNQEGYVASRPLVVKYKPKERSVRDVRTHPPTLWALLVGISDYRGELNPLKFAAKDAENMGAAVKIAGDRYFEKHVRMTVLSTGASGTRPTKANIMAALKIFEDNAAPEDYLLVYLAGHGMTYGTPSDYYYLTEDSITARMQDPEVRKLALSGVELQSRLHKIRALKQVLILDTCAAGRVVERLAAERVGDSSRELILDRMSDRAGLYILAGSAADAVSYEASRFGQGVLTYSLLFTMRGEALVSNQFLDVDRWFETVTDAVPRLVQGIGGVQAPIRKTPRAGTFVIGQLLDEDKLGIPVASTKPVITTPLFFDEASYGDPIKVGQKVHDILYVKFASSLDPSYIVVDSNDFPKGNSIRGAYRLENGVVVMKVNILVDGIRKDGFELRLPVGGKTDEAAALSVANAIVREVEARIKN